MQQSATDGKGQLWQALDELRNTPEKHRRGKLQRLTKPILVQVAEVMIRKWERERTRLLTEIEKRDYHIERLEALLEPKRSG